METVRITGKNRLSGEVRLQGAKNSALPILAAAASVDGVSVIYNCPRLSDVDAAIKILRFIGCKVEREGDTVTVDATDVSRCDVPRELMCEMRSSVIFLAPLLARLGMAEISAPGGCEIGLRPIDLHLSSLRLMGAQIETEGGVLSCRCPDGLRGEKITLSFPSVGATENILIAAASAEGETVILNAAREPEIADLADFLCSCGAHISGAGSGEITVCGMKKLHSAEHTVIPDRIIASTYMAAAAVTGGDVRILDTRAEHITPVIPVFEQAGCKVDCGENSVHISAPVRLRSVQTVRTMPYPGFPTDMQPQMTALLSIADGTSFVSEGVWDNRFRYVEQLTRMGASIKVEGKMAVIEGVEQLKGAPVRADDLRAGAAMIIAGLIAKGTTEIEEISHIDRGYENIVEKLTGLGADIRRVDRPEPDDISRAV